MAEKTQRNPKAPQYAYATGLNQPPHLPAVPKTTSPAPNLHKKQLADETEQLSHDQALDLLHQLRVHQIQLEMQNEQLIFTRHQLKETQAHFQDLYEHAPLGYCTITPDGIIVSCNLAFAAMVGRQQDSLPKQPFSDYLAPDSAPAMIHALQQPDHDEQELELQIQHTNQKRFWGLVRMAPIRDHNGNATQKRLTVTDISELKKTQNTLNTLNKNLEEMVSQRTAEAEQRAEQLHALAGQLVHAEQHERQRIAKMLHDELQQLQVAAKLTLGRARVQKTDEQMLAAINEADNIIGQAIQVARSLTSSLSPPVLDNAGLNPALQWLAEWCQKNHGLQVQLQTSPKAEPAEKHLRWTLFEGIRECLLNVVKHAGVKNAHVTLERLHPNIILASVKDQGQGFDFNNVFAAREKKGFGLLGLSERFKHIGGHVAIDTAPERGTTVTMRVTDLKTPPLPPSP